MERFKYLASPYSDPDPLVREDRYLKASACLRHLLLCKVWTYSPIAHCHELSKIWGMPSDAAFWKEYDEEMIRASNGLFVLKLPGWSQSVGVKSEIQFAIGLNLPITYLSAEGFSAQITLGGDQGTRPATASVRPGTPAGAG